MGKNIVLSGLVLMITYLCIGASAYLNKIGSNSEKGIGAIIIMGIVCFAITILAGKETIIDNPRTRTIIYVIVLIVALSVFSLYCWL